MSENSRVGRKTPNKQTKILLKLKLQEHKFLEDLLRYNWLNFAQNWFEYFYVLYHHQNHQGSYIILTWLLLWHLRFSFRIEQKNCQTWSKHTLLFVSVNLIQYYSHFVFVGGGYKREREREVEGEKQLTKKIPWKFGSCWRVPMADLICTV